MSPKGSSRPATAHARTASPKHPRSKANTPQRDPSDPPSAADIITQAQRTLEAAHGLENTLQQYVLTHRAALQAAAAVVTARQRPEHRLGRRARVRGTWDLLPELAPEFAEYAKYFQNTTVKMIRAEAGIVGAVDVHELADLRRFSTEFVRKVAALDEVARPPTRTADGGSATTMRRTS
ncbi:SAV_6107 family HEPN domain-containing protein [Streptomyces sp. x-80]|uniref:SAV_6107 family HEPN domain-containing protein n=1 Tax=Streptomyces sp. x-80 TaxID=2789282 RepID=UPI00397F12D7